MIRFPGSYTTNDRRYIRTSGAVLIPRIPLMSSSDSENLLNKIKENTPTNASFSFLFHSNAFLRIVAYNSLRLGAFLFSTRFFKRSNRSSFFSEMNLIAVDAQINNPPAVLARRCNHSSHDQSSGTRNVLEDLNSSNSCSINVKTSILFSSI